MTLAMLLASHQAMAASQFEPVRKILVQHCLVCHGEYVKNGGIDLTSYKRVKALTTNGDPMLSKIYRVVALKKMPPSDHKLTPQELSIMAKWIAGGAKP